MHSRILRNEMRAELSRGGIAAVDLAEMVGTPLTEEQQYMLRARSTGPRLDNDELQQASQIAIILHRAVAVVKSIQHDHPEIIAKAVTRCS